MTDIEPRGVLTGTARWLGRLVLLALALLVAAAVVVVVVLPRATNGAALTVLTGSMAPQIPVGSIVLVRPVDPGTVEVGDVVTYQVAPDREVFITHRVVEVLDEGRGLRFVLQGDANRGPDLDPVPAGAIRGEVWFHVPHLGAVRDGLHGRGGITLVAMILLAGYAVAQVSGGLRERRRRRTEEAGGPTTALVVGRTLVVATLARTTDQDPAATARAWGALLLDEDDSSFTLLLAPPDDGVEAALELLRGQHPISLETWASPTMTGRRRVAAPVGAPAEATGAPA